MIEDMSKINIDIIARAMGLKKGTPGLYRCFRLPYHAQDNDFTGSLSICEDGRYSCKCGLSGHGFISLYSKVYGVPYRLAEVKLINRILRLAI